MGCHIHYNAKTNIDDFNVTDIFDAKWGNQTFILPLDLRPFDNIGKTFKKYHRDYNQISNKQKQQQQQRHHQKKASSTSSIIPKPINNENNDNKKIINIKNNKNRTFNHDTYKFEPPFPSVQYIVSADTTLEKLGIKTPKNTIPEAFYSSIVEPITNSFAIIRGISQQTDSKLSPSIHQQ